MKKNNIPKLCYLGIMLRQDQLDILRGLKATGISMGYIVRLALDNWITQGEEVENDEMESDELWGRI